MSENIEREDGMREKGVKRYRAAKAEAALKSVPSSQGSGVALLVAVIPDLAAAIKEACDGRKHTRGPKPAWLSYLKRLKPEVIALIAARSVFDGMATRKKLTAMASSVASRIEDELKLCHFAKSDPRSYKKALEQVGGSQDYKYRRRVLLGLMSKCESVPGFENIGNKLKVRVGVKIVELMASSTGTIYVEKQGGANIVLSTPEFEAAIMDADSRLEVMTPCFGPMLTVPMPWTGTIDGGYESLPLSLVRTKSEEHGGHAEQRPTDVMLGGINALQSTPWTIDEDVLMVVNEMWGMENRPLPGVPSRAEYPKPPRPSGLPKEVKVKDMDPVQAELHKAYKQALARNIEAEVKRKSKILTASQIRQVAKKLVGHTFFFPMSMDFRGRCYYVPIFLSPMSTDLSRGLLQFKDGQPFGSEEAVEWFLVTGANHAGHDKVSFAERIQWVADHHVQIMMVADDPISNTWWTEAGKESWQFLSWALEYARWEEAGRTLDFVSHTVCAVDATCSGLQILSAAALDEVGGASVNLTETDQPSDIYAEVAAVVLEKLIEAGKDRTEKGRLCRMLVNSDLINRSACKRGTMCYVYGVTKHGMVDQLIEYFNKLEDDGQVLPLDNPFYAAIELKEHLHAAITEVVIKGTEVMNWLRAIARKTSLRGLPLRWTTPHGFRVTQSYRNKKEARVRTKISGSVHLVVYEYGKKIAPGKQISSIAPNWVHALDADLMLETIHAHRKEVAAAPFSAVHDCYGTLACHLPRLSEIVRQEFVKLFSDDLLTRFRDEIEADTGISLADLPVPSFGNLDLEEVLRSKFFFS